MSRIVDIVIPVFNGADIIADTVESALSQQVPPDWNLRIIVSDDGSTDGTAEVLSRLAIRHKALTVTSARKNQGRAAARNAGVQVSGADIIVFCDADCRYLRSDTIYEFVRDIEAGNDAVAGLFEARGDSFWARYFNEVSKNRPVDRTRLGLMTFTTANFCIRREFFQALAGFSDVYSKYGFEDKDFLIRLEEADARVSLRPDLVVSHDDDLTVARLTRKAFESGRYCAATFRARHPDRYRLLPYSRCDRHTGPVALPYEISLAAAAITRTAASGLVAVPGLPFALKRFAVRVAVCAAYHTGTTHEKSETGA